MYQVNDRVMYSTTGVCEIVEIRKQTVLNCEMEYYVLNPVYKKNSTIMAPVNNAGSLMRNVTSKEDVNKILSSFSSYETNWVEDDRQRAEYFRERMKTYDVVEWVKVIKNILNEQRQRNEAGKKLRQSDENVLKNAQRLVSEEFATSLSIDIEEIEDFIKSNIKCG